KQLDIGSSNRFTKDFNILKIKNSPLCFLKPSSLDFNNKAYFYRVLCVRHFRSLNQYHGKRLTAARKVSGSTSRLNRGLGAYAPWPNPGPYPGPPTPNWRSSCCI